VTPDRACVASTTPVTVTRRTVPPPSAELYEPEAYRSPVPFGSRRARVVSSRLRGVRTGSTGSSSAPLMAPRRPSGPHLPVGCGGASDGHDPLRYNMPTNFSLTAVCPSVKLKNRPLIFRELVPARRRRPVPGPGYGENVRILSGSSADHGGGKAVRNPIGHVPARESRRDACRFPRPLLARRRPCTSTARSGAALDALREFLRAFRLIASRARLKAPPRLAALGLESEWRSIESSGGATGPSGSDGGACSRFCASTTPASPQRGAPAAARTSRRHAPHFPIDCTSLSTPGLKHVILPPVMLRSPYSDKQAGHRPASRESCCLRTLRKRQRV